MIVLYGAMASRAHRVVWMLKELALPFEHVQTNFLDGSTRTPAFLGVNPNGRVPALDDGGFLMCESMAINLYLAKKYGNGIAPADLNIATVMDLAPQCGISLAAWPNVNEWHARCLARPAAQDWKSVKFSIPRPPTALGLLKMFV